MARIASFRGLGCLITGASAGIGQEIALQLAAEGARLVVTARREDRLEALVKSCRDIGAQVAYAIPADLGDPGAPAYIAEQATNHLGHVDVLINNAGFGKAGLFHKAPRERLLEMIQVNVTASVDLAHRLLPGMLERDRGGILSVASMAAYQPAPYTSTYGATKAFLLEWSGGLHQEYKESGVIISALCPGVTDTEFFDVAGWGNLSGFLNNRMSSARVARVGLDALRKGKMEAMPGAMNNVAIFAQRFLPRTWVAAMSRRLMGGRPYPTRTR